ncbi:MAG TPA: type 4a pilus biogenesis protein PilO, partial [Actinomycetota bacterium]|nr:type 4a pilus biogenesis protein PilO [Actinomycetota bacterium]
MPLRTRAILIGVGFVVLTMLWFFFLFRPNQARIAELRTEQQTTEQQIDQLRIRLAELQRLRDQEPMLRAQLARFTDALPEDPRLPDFILQVEEQANLAGIEFLSITPSLPAPYAGAGDPAAVPPAAPAGGGELQAISVSISTTGTYFELLDFILRLERQIPRAVRLNNFALAPTGETARGQSPTLQVTFDMQMFLLSPVPVAPGAAPQPPTTEAPASTEAPPPTET